MNSDAELRGLEQALVADHELVAAYLFGSFARGSARPDSDVDVAVLYTAQAAAAPRDYLQRLARLTQAAGRDVHLVELEGADSDLCRSIFERGRLLFDRSDGRLAALELRKLIDYADWEYGRRVIDSAIRRKLVAAGG